VHRLREMKHSSQSGRAHEVVAKAVRVLDVAGKRFEVAKLHHDGQCGCTWRHACGSDYFVFHPAIAERADKVRVRQRPARWIQPWAARNELLEQAEAMQSAGHLCQSSLYKQQWLPARAHSCSAPRAATPWPCVGALRKAGFRQRVHCRPAARVTVDDLDGYRHVAPRASVDAPKAGMSQRGANLDVISGQPDVGARRNAWAWHARPCCTCLCG
jgi:hypothetical protein